MKCLVILVILSVALTSWARYIGTNLDSSYDYGLGLTSTIHFKPSYTTSKPVYVNTLKPYNVYYGYKPYYGHSSAYGYGYKPYYGHGSAYGYGYKPYYASSKPYHTYRPYYGYKPYYGYGSSYLNPYYYGSYDLGLGYGHGSGYTDW